MGMFNLIFLSGGITLPSGDDFVSKVFPNIWAFLVQLFAFIIMVIIVSKFAYKPVKKFLDARREYIENSFKEIDSKKLEAEKDNLEAKENLTNAKKEALSIVSKAKKDAEILKEESLEQTKKEIQEKRLQAQEDLRKEQEKAIKNVHDEVVDLAYLASKNILQREIDSDDNRKLVDDFVDELIEKR